MGLMTAAQYRESLNDGRIVYYKGKKIGNVCEHPHLAACVNTVAVDYEMAHDPKYKDLALVYDEELQENISRYNYLPKNGQDLLKQLDLIIKATELGNGYIPLAHDIGADAMNAIAITARTMGDAGKEYATRIEKYRTYLKKTDKCVVAGVTDAKGDRRLRPSDPGQAHPDFHVRLVSKDDKGIIVRGAKVHITGAAYCNEFFVIPCRALSGPEDAPYAVAFAIPANTKGVRQIVRPFHGLINDDEFPVKNQWRNMHTDSLIIFDDVFVPWDRVFLCGEWKFAATMVYNFALMHRRTGCAYRIPLSEQLLGVAQAIAEYNGIADAPHVKEKITDIVIYLETLNALARSACLDFVEHAGIPVPNPITTNIAKYHFAHNYHRMMEIIQDLAGGLLVTAPTYRDWTNPETHDDIKKYLQGKASVSTEDRLRMFDLIRRVTSGDQETICLHGEGSPYAERMTILMEAKKIIARCKAIAEGMAGIKK
jgi:4-hydroxybutyryl-CoA dehydratase / vinylacetyl-CoA-Delta-isomerase